MPCPGIFKWSCEECVQDRLDAEWYAQEAYQLLLAEEEAAAAREAVEAAAREAEDAEILGPWVDYY